VFQHGSTTSTADPQTYDPIFRVWESLSHSQSTSSGRRNPEIEGSGREPAGSPIRSIRYVCSVTVDDTWLTNTVMTYIWEIVQREGCTTDSFMPVDEVAVEVFGKLTHHNELPPIARVRGT
jgi:hypothetical protein